jgi:hypothetical protein
MKFIALKLCLVLLLLPLVGCGGDKTPTREEFIQYSRETVSALRDVVPILRANNVSTDKLQKGIDIGDRLIAAFENNQSAQALELTAALVTAFQEVVVDVDVIKDARLKTLVLVGLAVGHVALQHLASLMDTAVVTVESSHLRIPGVTAFQSGGAESKAAEDKAKIKAFSKKKQWRCKKALTGRFEKMEFCKANPATSYVVTFNR